VIQLALFLFGVLSLLVARFIRRRIRRALIRRRIALVCRRTA
jgi:hypothetical protein